MRKQPHPLREQPPTVIVHQVIHPDVVLGYVLVCGGVCSGLFERHLGRHATGKPLSKTDFCPLATRPRFPLGQPLLQRREGEVEENYERELVREHVIADVRSRVVAGERLVEAVDRSEVEVGLPLEIEADLEHVTVQFLQKTLEADEHRIQGFRIAGEIVAHEVFELAARTVLSAPEFPDLGEAGVHPVALFLPVADDEFLLERLGSCRVPFHSTVASRNRLRVGPRLPARHRHQDNDKHRSGRHQGV